MNHNNSLHVQPLYAVKSSRCIIHHLSALLEYKSIFVISLLFSIYIKRGNPDLELSRLLSQTLTSYQSATISFSTNCCHHPKKKSPSLTATISTTFDLPSRPFLVPPLPLRVLRNSSLTIAHPLRVNAGHRNTFHAFCTSSHVIFNSLSSKPPLLYVSQRILALTTLPLSRGASLPSRLSRHFLWLSRRILALANYNRLHPYPHQRDLHLLSPTLFSSATHVADEICSRRPLLCHLLLSPRLPPSWNGVIDEIYSILCCRQLLLSLLLLSLKSTCSVLISAILDVWCSSTTTSEALNNEFSCVNNICCHHLCLQLALMSILVLYFAGAIIDGIFSFLKFTLLLLMP